MVRATLNSLSAISSRNLASFSSLRARDAGDIFASSPENFLAIFPYLFLPQLFDVLIVQPVCYRDEHVVPSVVARLVATDEQQCNPARVERVQHAIWLPAVLDAQLAHVVVLGLCDAGAIREPKPHGMLLQQLHAGAHIFLFFRREAVPPIAEFIGELDLTFHIRIIT